MSLKGCDISFLTSFSSFVGIQQGSGDLESCRLVIISNFFQVSRRDQESCHQLKC